MAEETIGWFAAVDWGSEKHQACVLDARGGVAGEREFPHSGAGLTELADWVRSITGEASVVAIAVEVPHGPVVDVLLDRGFIVHLLKSRLNRTDGVCSPYGGHRHDQGPEDHPG